MRGHKLSPDIKAEIVRLRDEEKLPYKIMGKMLNMNPATLKVHYYSMKGLTETKMRLKESPFQRFDDPPEIEGDWLIIPDAEIPFHDYEFLNRVFDVADKWGIKNFVSSGDLLHFESLTGWNPNWNKKIKSGLSEINERRLVDKIMGLPSKYQGELLEEVADIGGDEKEITYAGEMNEARKTLKIIDEMFDKLVWVLGNHEGRLLSALEVSIDPNELLLQMKLIGKENQSSKWIIAPYYFCILHSKEQTFRIEHPKPFSANTAVKLASINLCHVIMGHSHIVNQQFDPSGNYYAWHIGHCADEKRFAYEAQRSRQTSAVPHKHGAVIVRDGYPWLLHDMVDWKRLKECK